MPARQWDGLGRRRVAEVPRRIAEQRQEAFDVPLAERWGSADPKAVGKILRTADLDEAGDSVVYRLPGDAEHAGHHHDGSADVNLQESEAATVDRRSEVS